MVLGLERRQVEGDLHFVTFSCYHRLPYLDTPLSRDLFEDALARTCYCYEFDVLGYVVMPEHVHLLLSEPGNDLLAVGLQALKISVSKRAKERPFWQARYYDFNVFTEAKRIEKLHYMHWNPVKRGLVEAPEDWLVELSLLRDRGAGESEDHTVNSVPREDPGCPTSRSFFARCGIPLLSARTFLTVVKNTS